MPWVHNILHSLGVIYSPEAMLSRNRGKGPRWTRGEYATFALPCCLWRTYISATVAGSTGHMGNVRWNDLRTRGLSRCPAFAGRSSFDGMAAKRRVSC
jgi:hypothetical protein